MNLHEMQQKRGEIGEEIRTLAAIEPDQFTAEDEKRWDTLNKQYDDVVKDIEAELTKTRSYEGRQDRLNKIMDQSSGIDAEWRSNSIANLAGTPGGSDMTNGGGFGYSPHGPEQPGLWGQHRAGTKIHEHVRDPANGLYYQNSPTGRLAYRNAAPTGMEVQVTDQAGERSATRAFNAEDSVAAFIQRSQGHPNMPSVYDCDLGRFAIALATGDWKRAPAEAEWLRRENRALDTSGGSGGIAVPSMVSGTWFDRLRAQMRVQAAGAQYLQMPSESTKVAAIDQTSDIVFDLDKTQNAAITETDVVFGGKTLVAKTQSAITRASDELMNDGVNVASMITRELSASLAEKLDWLALQGTGTGMALGVQLDTDVPVLDATLTPLLTWDILSSETAKLRTQGAEPSACLLSPFQHDHLHRTKTGDGTNSSAYWQGNPGHGLPNDRIFYTKNSLTTTATLGDWQSLLWGVRNSVELNYTRTAGGAFEKYQSAWRIVIRTDFAVIRPLAFRNIQNLTAA